MRVVGITGHARGRRPGRPPRAPVALLCCPPGAAADGALLLNAPGSGRNMPARPAVPGRKDGFRTDCPGAAPTLRLPVIRKTAARLQGRS